MRHELLNCSKRYGPESKRWANTKIWPEIRLLMGKGPGSSEDLTEPAGLGVTPTCTQGAKRPQSRLEVEGCPYESPPHSALPGG